MTLIACLHPRQCRTLFSDILVSAENTPASDVVLPTRAYIAPNKLRETSRKPVALRRKVIEITPELVALWAGDFQAAVCLAKRAKDWFDNNQFSEVGLVGFLDTYYAVPTPNFHAIIAPCATDWFFVIGGAYRSTSPFCGEYAVAGSGAELFRRMVDHMPARADGAAMADIDGLRLANDLMAQEISNGETLRLQFGAGYEVLYRGPNCYERVDDVVHVFAEVEISDSGLLKVGAYPHVTRQWYEDDQLCFASLSTPELEQQGIGFRAFVVPSILKDAIEPVRQTDTLSERPRYLCMHHLFKFERQSIPSSLTMRGDGIDEIMIFSKEGSELRLEFTALYIDRLHNMANRVVEKCRSQRD